MGKLRSERSKIEFGDFQTPIELATAVCQRLSALGVLPRSVVEPTCGVGNLLLAATAAFPGAESVFGMDVNAEYVQQVRARIGAGRNPVHTVIERSSFFGHDWPTQIAGLAEPILFIGNPPWVTSSDLGYLQSHNIPEKANLHGLAGLDALTGKSNFDISEWMLTRLLTWLDGRRAVVAMLCKTAVARKVMVFGWESALQIQAAWVHRIDGAKHFNASVDACLLIVEMGVRSAEQTCPVFPDLRSTDPESTFGRRDGILVADAALYDRRRALIGDERHKWRSGIKHDCAALMELTPTGDGFVNGDGERIHIEDHYLYPMLKSSDVARAGTPVPRRRMLVTQSFVGEDTSSIKRSARKTWDYLNQHKERFQRRGSSIYRGKPAFSVFGVGDYTFAAWKVAISGLYKRLDFKVIGPHDEKPVVLDDTCYFMACRSEAEARFLARLLASPAAHEFFAAFIFWDAKRPITADILRRLDFRRLAAELGLAKEFDQVCLPEPPPSLAPEQGTLTQLGLSLGEVPVLSR